MSVLRNRSGLVKVRYLASIVGRIQSAKPAVGCSAKIMTKFLHMCIETRQHWYDYVCIDNHARKELMFWQENICILNGQPFTMDTECTVEVQSDASAVGFGGYVSEIDGSEAIGRWSRLEAMESSTWRELKAVYYVLCALADKLRQEHIRWKVDNMNVVHILHNGSMKKKLQLILLDIWHFSDENNIVYCA